MWPLNWMTRTDTKQSLSGTEAIFKWCVCVCVCVYVCVYVHAQAYVCVSKQGVYECVCNMCVCLLGVTLAQYCEVVWEGDGGEMT